MDDLASEGLDAGERLPEVGHGEVGKREAVTRPLPALVQPERDSFLPSLPTPSLPLRALGEGLAQQPLPEPTRPLRIVCGELDER